MHSVQYGGIVEAIFAHYEPIKSESLVLIRCLYLVCPDPSNQLVVHKFGIKPYSYCVSHSSHINLRIVPEKHLLVNPYWFEREQGISHRFDVTYAKTSLQNALRFFRVHCFNIYERKQQQGSAAWFLVFLVRIAQHIHWQSHYLPVLFTVPYNFIKSTFSNFPTMFTTHIKYVCIIALTVLNVRNSFMSSHWLLPLPLQLHIPTSTYVILCKLTKSKLPFLLFWHWSLPFSVNS